jgi:hypothetical protein
MFPNVPTGYERFAERSLVGSLSVTQADLLACGVSTVNGVNEQPVA